MKTLAVLLVALLVVGRKAQPLDAGSDYGTIGDPNAETSDPNMDSTMESMTPDPPLAEDQVDPDFSQTVGTVDPPPPSKFDSTDGSLTTPDSEGSTDAALPPEEAGAAGTEGNSMSDYGSDASSQSSLDTQSDSRDSSVSDYGSDSSSQSRRDSQSDSRDSSVSDYGSESQGDSSMSDSRSESRTPPADDSRSSSRTSSSDDSESDTTDFRSSRFDSTSNSETRPSSRFSTEAEAPSRTDSRLSSSRSDSEAEAPAPPRSDSRSDSRTDSRSSRAPAPRTDSRSDSRTDSRSSRAPAPRADARSDSRTSSRSSSSDRPKSREEERVANSAWAVDDERKTSKTSKECTPGDEVPDGSEYPFYYGYSSSAYQYEGAAQLYGRTPSIWDAFSKWSGKVLNDDNGDQTVDFYDKFEDDIKLMQTLGVKNFRFSISWPRVMPYGNGTINRRGMEFYQRLVDALKAACIEPHVTLYHWDLPFSLQTKFKGWINEDVVGAYAAYAENMFKALGNKVKYWVTFNQPYTFCMLGYGWGVHAPGRCTGCIGGGNTEIEPYLCQHNVVRAHARAASVFKKHVPDGKLSIALNIDWVEPFDPTNDTDVDSVTRHLDLAVRFFADPIFKGRYPKTLHDMIPSLPRLTPQEIRMLLNNKPDYWAVNHYTTYFIKFDFWTAPPIQYQQLKRSKNGTRLGPSADSPWLSVWPKGIRRMLNWVADEYDDPEIVIYENGYSVIKEATADYPDLLNDVDRMQYFQAYLDEIKKAIEFDDVNVVGYFAWTFMDCFEWSDGFSKKFGTVYVNMTSLERRPKNSAFWMSRKFNTLPDDIPYSKRLFLPSEVVDQRQKLKEEADAKRKAEERTKMGDLAPIKLSDLVEQMGDDAVATPDPATNPFNGGRKL